MQYFSSCRPPLRRSPSIATARSWSDARSCPPSPAPCSSRCAATIWSTLTPSRRPRACSPNLDDPAGCAQGCAALPRIAKLDDVLANSDGRHARCGQAVAARAVRPAGDQGGGVTFVASMLERVIEEQARGDPAQGRSGARARSSAIIGDDLRERAARLARGGAPQGRADRAGRVVAVPRGRHRARRRDLHQVAADVRGRARAPTIGIHPKSEWNNPEPEIVLVGRQRAARTVGATLGNDVNLRDFEGRSALLLGKAKDNNASCAIGPFIRLFDERFHASTTCAGATSRCASRARTASCSTARAPSAMISRDPLDLVGAGDRRQSPVSGRLRAVPRHDVRADEGPARPGQGFTHVVGDIVTIVDAEARHARQSRRTPPTGSRRGPSARAR